MRILGTITVVLAFLWLLPLIQSAHAQDQTQDLTFFRIGTGGLGDLYTPSGAVIANAISNPPGMRACREDTSCGVPGLVAVAKSSSGSVHNIDAILSGRLDSAFVQADILHWAYEGNGFFYGEEPLDNLRVLANLFDETIHIVANKWADIRTIEDLRGKRINIGPPDSDSNIEARLILRAFDLHIEKDYTATYHKAQKAGDLLREGRIDAFIIVTTPPSSVISSLLDENVVTLLDISGEPLTALIEKHPFLHRTTIDAGTYGDLPAVHSLALPTHWVTTQDLDDNLAYQLVRALWYSRQQDTSKEAQRVLRNIANDITYTSISAPFHKGAQLFHAELRVLQARQQNK